MTTTTADQPTTEAARLWAAFRQLAFDLADPSPTTATPDDRIGQLLRAAGRWDGVSRLVIFDPPRLWAALHRGELTVDDLTEGTHYVLKEGA
mgnify:CR=1 FL=1